jgi:hypothetical protein
LFHLETKSQTLAVFVVFNHVRDKVPVHHRQFGGVPRGECPF